jgi:hypothetical protein
MTLMAQYICQFAFWHQVLPLKLHHISVYDLEIPQNQPF